MTSIVALRAALEELPKRTHGDATDFQIARALGPGYLAQSPSGAPTLLVPFDSLPNSAGRTGGGFKLTMAPRVSFSFESRRWEQAAGILECTEPSLFETFLVLVVDIAERLERSALSWNHLVKHVEDWQMLLARRAILTAEAQLGLWAEVWMLAQSVEPDRLLSAWRGPDHDAVDFFVDGLGLEVKASRQRRIHHISHRQLNEPTGDFESYVCSLWLGVDPERGRSLAELVDSVSNRVSDLSAFMRLVTSTGYSAADREHYSTRYIPLDTPLLFKGDDIPRVRSADSGISNLRYMVTLDETRAISDTQAPQIWQRLIGFPKPSDREQRQ